MLDLVHTIHFSAVISAISMMKRNQSQNHFSVVLLVVYEVTVLYLVHSHQSVPPNPTEHSIVCLCICSFAIGSFERVQCR